MRRYALAIGFLLSLLTAVPAAAQVCSGVPALPDVERRTQYVISAQTGPLSVGFAIYGDSTDFGNWLQVYVNGALQSAASYNVTSPTTTLATGCRPITDAQVTFLTAQTGTVQIVGARRPRRAVQFPENRGVPARDHNQVLTDIVAQNRETWDLRQRTLQGVPGDNFGPLPQATARASQLLGFDPTGAPVTYPLGSSINATAGQTFNTRALAAAASISASVAYVQTAGFGTAGDGGGAIYSRAGGASTCGFQSADGQQWQLAERAVYLKMCGAKGDGATDDATAINLALTLTPFVYCSDGTYNISATITFSGSGAGMVGNGVNRCIIRSTSTTAPVITIATGTTQYRFENFAVTRSVTATAGASGIAAIGATIQGSMTNLVVEKNWVGMQLGATDSGRINNVTAWKNLSDGIIMSPGVGSCAAAACALQWQLDDVLSTQNAGRGIAMVSANGCTQISAGEWRSVQTFANSSYGLQFAGTVGCPIQGLRIRQVFVGADGNDEIYLDTFNTAGNAHLIESPYVEVGGTTATGPTLATGPSNSSIGIVISANNNVVNIIAPIVTGQASSCINSSAAFTNISGPGLLTNCGQGGASVSGVIVAAGRASIQGMQIGNTGGNVTQQYGVVLAAGTDHNRVALNDLRTNTTQPVLNSSIGTNNVIEFNDSYNPVGMTAAATMGASPATITAGPTRETHYIRQAATNTATVAKGAQQILTLKEASTYYTVELGPNESYVTTWVTTAPTYTRDVH